MEESCALMISLPPTIANKRISSPGTHKTKAETMWLKPWRRPMSWETPPSLITIMSAPSLSNSMPISPYYYSWRPSTASYRPNCSPGRRNGVVSNSSTTSVTCEWRASYGSTSRYPRTRISTSYPIWGQTSRNSRSSWVNFEWLDVIPIIKLYAEGEDTAASVYPQDCPAAGLPWNFQPACQRWQDHPDWTKGHVRSSGVLHLRGTLQGYLRQGIRIQRWSDFLGVHGGVSSERFAT